MNEISPSDPFTQTDVESALECYDERYCTFPRDDISKLSDIQIQKNKRNGLKQSDHLYLARRRKEDMKILHLDWKAPEGRPTKGDQVRSWRKTHPDGIKAECVRDLGISRRTADKYWDMNT